MKEITDYIEHVRANPSAHADKTRQSVERIAEMVERVKAGEIIYNADEVGKIFRFFEKLVPDKSGKTIKLMPWQRFFIASIFGFRSKDGLILLNDIFLFIAKKNGKTAIIAGIALYYLITTKDAQVLLAASDYSQAKIAFEIIKKYIENTPIMKAAQDDHAIVIKESPPLNIHNVPNDSAIRIVPETRAKQANGFNPNFVMFDEIASYRTSKIMTALASGQIKDNAIRASLTTAETNMQNPGMSEYERAKQILNGKYSAPNYFPLIYELDQDDDKWDEKTYCKANPSLNIIKPIRKVVEDRERARQNPVEEASFFAYQLNVWSQNAATDISEDDWRPAITNAEKYADYIRPEKLKEYPCYGAIDLSKVDDYTAYTLYHYIKPINCYYAKHRFYIPKAMLESKVRVETEQVTVWVNQGHIQATMDGEGDRVINKEYILADIGDDIESYGENFMGITYDAAHALEFIGELSKRHDNLQHLAFSQTWKQIGPANKLFLELMYKGRLIDPSPVMRWMVGCVRIDVDRIGNTYFQKVNYRQSPLRIDGVDTSVMALARLSAIVKEGDGNIEQQIDGYMAIEY